MSKVLILDTARKYFFNTTWLFFEKATGTVLVFIVSTYLARYLRPASYGLFSYLVSIAVFFLPLANLGLEQVLIKYLASKDENRISVFLGTSFLLRIIGSLCVLCMLILAAGLIEPSVKWYVIVVGIGFFFQAFNVIELYFQSQVLSKYAVIAQFIANILSSVLKIICIMLKMNFGVFVMLVLVDDILLSVGYIFMYSRHKLSIWKWRFDAELGKEFMKASWPIIVCGFSIVAYMRLNQIMLKNMINNEAVGYYAAALRISEIWYMIPTIVMYSIYPYFIGIHHDRKKYFFMLQVFYEFSTLLSLIVLIFLRIFANGIINVLYGAEYVRAGSLLGIMIIVMPVIFFGISKMPWVILENRQFTLSLYTLLGLSANIILNYFLIPRFREYGTIFATIFTQLLVNILLPLFNNTDRLSVIMFLKSLFPFRLIRFVKENNLLAFV